MIIEIIKGKINLKNNKISSDPKIEYPELKLDDKRATTD